MVIKGTQWDPLINGTNSTTGQNTPRSISSDVRFLDILSIWQDDGVVAKDAAQPVDALSEEQKATLRDTFDITNLASLQDKRGLLNELVKLGIFSAQESELSMMQMLPPMGSALLQTQNGNLLGASAWDAGSDYEAVMNEPDYLKYLEGAIKYDELWSRADDVKNARLKLYDILSDIYT